MRVAVPTFAALVLTGAVAAIPSLSRAQTGTAEGRPSSAIQNSPEHRAMTWSADDLAKIVAVDDLHIAPFREDGATYGTPTWIWSVAIDGNLYVRAYNGQQSRWYQAALRQKAGRIIAAGQTWEVLFEPVDSPINDRIDDAYRSRYRGSRYLEPMIGAGPRSATVRVLPR